MILEISVSIAWSCILVSALVLINEEHVYGHARTTKILDRACQKHKYGKMTGILADRHYAVIVN